MPLSTKGEFYAINMEVGGADDQDARNVDLGLQRLSSLLKRTLPLRVRLVAGPALPPPLHPALTTGLHSFVVNFIEPIDTHTLFFHPFQALFFCEP